MIWEFKEDKTYKRRVDIKYYAFDEILEFIGGNFAGVMVALAIFLHPYSKTKFVINNSSK